MPEPRLELCEVTKVYPGGWGLHRASLAVPPATIVALGGPNGSGKSTLLRCAAGLVRFAGAVRVDGRPVDAAPASRASIGYLPQAVSLPEHASIDEVVQLFARLRGAGAGSSALPDGFLRAGTTRIGTLSGGQRHRVALAIALLGDPTLLLFDEPVASLDDEGRETFWSLLRRLRDERGTTAIVSSPSPSDLRGLVDRAVYLREGRVVLQEEIGAGDDEGRVREPCG